jgi:hypothetical protein
MRLLSAVAVATVFATGCATVVRKPEVNVVKKVAIVSVYADQTLKKVDGKGQNGGGANFLAKAAGVEDPDQDKRIQLMQYALETFRKELGQVPDWSVVSDDQILTNAFYQELEKFKSEGGAGSGILAAAVGAMSTLHQAKWTTPPKMYALELTEKDASDAERLNKLKELCEKLQVDAVATVHLDLGYEDGIAAFGQGQAKASVAGSMKVVTREGKMAVVFPDLAKAPSKRYISDNGALMLNGRLFLNEDAQAMYKDAIAKTAVGMRGVIQEGLAAK